jgi:hypothetical protein
VSKVKVAADRPICETQRLLCSVLRAKTLQAGFAANDGLIIVYYFYSLIALRAKSAASPHFPAP